MRVMLHSIRDTRYLEPIVKDATLGPTEAVRHFGGSCTSDFALRCSPGNGARNGMSTYNGLNCSPVRANVAVDLHGPHGPKVTSMIARLFGSLVFALAGLFITGAAAFAHPHVWVLMKSEIVFAPDGSVTGVRHAWTFDKDFSDYATREVNAKTPGEFSRAELAPLAEVNATSLKEFDYFTFARVGTRRSEFGDPR